MLIPCQKELFEIPDDITYLNCAYMAPQMRQVTQAGQEALKKKITPWAMTLQHFFEPVDLCRNLFAKVLKADAEGVALVPSASYGIQDLPKRVTE